MQIFLSLLALIVLIFPRISSSKQISLACTKDKIGVNCLILNTSIPSDHLSIASVTFASDVNKDPQVIEIALKNHSTFVPRKIGEKFPKIQHLIIQNSTLKFVKRHDFTAISRLELLSLFRNQIESLPPDVFHDLHDIRHIDLDYNLIAELPSDLLVNARELRTFIASNNRIQEIDGDFFRNSKKLTKIDLSDNLIKKVEIDFTKFTELYFLNLRRNYEDCDYYMDIDGMDLVMYKSDEEKYFLKMESLKSAIQRRCGDEIIADYT